MTINNINFIVSIVVGVYIVVMVVVGRYLTYLDLFLPRKRPNGSIELKDYDFQNIEFESPDRITLRGWFIRSNNNPSNKTIFILPGWTRTRSRYIPQIKFFVNSGFHVFTYDQRSHGASDTGLVTYGPREGEDLIAAIEFSKRLGVDPDRIGFVGFSLGAISGIYAAEKQVFKAVVLEGVFSKSYEMGEAILIDRVGERFTKLFGYAFFWVGAMVWTLGRFKHSSPIDHIGKISPTPILIIRGEHDKTVPAYSAQKMIAAANMPKEIWIHKGGHTKSFTTYPEEYEKRVLSFLNKYL